MKPISIEHAEHYTWGGHCDGWHLVRGESLSVIQERMPPGATEVAHHHERARQFFYVLSGRLSFSVGDETIRLEPRQGLEIPPGVRHRAYNDGTASVEFVLVSTPPTAGDRINAS